MAFLIANLCCFEGSLPQGAPTSPTLSNIVCQRLDKKLSNLAKQYKSSYSRYADDITFSVRFDTFDGSFKAELKQIIQNEENFVLNPLKERKLDWRVRQEVTGLVVNQKLNVTREFIKDIRYWLRTWRTFGYEQTQQDFLKRYKTKKGFQRNFLHPPLFHKYLLGKILYLGMVRGVNDDLSIKFRSSFETASETIKAETFKNDLLFSYYEYGSDSDYLTLDNLR